MESNSIIRICGSVLKKESIRLLTTNKLENTVIAEANSPYANYYGNIPEKSVPNSLFLFTQHDYNLIDVLRFVKQIESCPVKSTDIASAVLSIKQNNYPAIRIKNFPDYKKLPELQKCFIKLGVEFTRKININNFAQVSINKCFVLKQISPEIFLDTVEKDKGYVIIDKLLNEDEFEYVISRIRNNSSCHLFDAAKCAAILESEATEMIRIFSEKLDTSLLKCIQNQFNQLTISN